MSKNSIDKLFKERLGQYEEAYPEHLWENVLSGISADESRKRRGAAWYSWLLLAGLLLFSAGVGVYIWQAFSDEQPVKSEQRTQEEDVPVSTFDQSHSSDETTDSHADVNQPQEQVSDLAATKNNNNQSEKNTRSDYISAEPTENETLSSTDLFSDENSIIAKEHGNREISDGLDGATLSTGIAGESTGNIKNNESSETPIFSSDRMDEGNTTSSLDGIARETYDNLSFLNQYDSKMRSISLDDESDKLRLYREVMPSLQTYSKRRFVGHWSIAPIYGMDWVFRSLDAKSEMDLGLLNQRKASESLENAFTAGAEVGLSIRRWTIYSGLLYTQINERVEYVLSGSEDGANGPIPGEFHRSVVNRYQMVHVPVKIGYRLSRGAWAVEPMIGVNVGLKMNTSGDVFDRNSLTYVSYDNESVNNPYRENIGLSYEAGITLSYATGFGQELFIRPNFRHFANDVTRNGYGLSQKYQSVGLLVGYKFKLY